MTTNPAMGVLLHAIGGLAAASFYAPLKKIQRWSWETYWLVMGVAAWLIAPWIVALGTTQNLFRVLSLSSSREIVLCLIFGMAWGVGNLTFGMSVRYLGMSLGYSVVLGFCMVVGTLAPPIVSGEISAVLSTASGQVIVGGVMVCLVGILLCGIAGVSREREQRAGLEPDPDTEFSPVKGFGLAAMAGILSACFAFGLAAGKPIATRSIEQGTAVIFSNNAVLVVVLLGGLISNAAWCLFLNKKNGSFSDYVTGERSHQTLNYGLAILGGATWYGQFFFYGMGTTKLGEEYDFSSWSIHMALIILFSNLWGIIFHEWRGTSIRTKILIWSGVLTLVACTILIGFGNFLSSSH